MSSETTIPTSTSDTSPSPSSSEDSSKSPINSNLYLFTFIATLLILLLVSSGVIIRAIILRYRYRQRLNRALELGLVPLDRGPTSKLSFGKTPKMYDVWLAPDDKTKTKTNPHSAWSDITPISVQPVSSLEEKHSLWASTISSKSKSQATIRSNTSATPTEFAADLLQVSVVIAMPVPPGQPAPAHALDDDDDEREVPEVALGFTHSYAS